MIKQLIILLLFVSMANAQTKTKNTGKGKTKTQVQKADTAGVIVQEDEAMDPMQELELTLPLESEIDALTGKMVFHKERKIHNDSARAALRAKIKQEKMTFRVYTRKTKKPKEKIQLCINIVAKDTFNLHFINDSICRDPEVSKLLFQKVVGDTVYALVYVDAFTKASWKPACSGGHETKLFFVRWNAPKGKAIWKTKTICSCIKAITNMTKTPIIDWDKESILEISYNRGSNFFDLKFDPAHPELGLQSSKEGE